MEVLDARRDPLDLGFSIRQVYYCQRYVNNPFKRKENVMETRNENIEIIELTVEELEERTAPGMVFAG
jgi:hypothetical protein